MLNEDAIAVLDAPALTVSELMSVSTELRIPISSTTLPNDLVLSESNGKRLIPQHEERRSFARLAHQIQLRIAPIVGEDLPRRRPFRAVLGHDVSQAGVSFFLSAMPYFEEFAVELGEGDSCISLGAQIVGVTRVRDLASYRLVHSRFTGRT